MGDLNSHSPMDADYMEANATRLLQKYSKENLLNGDFDYSVISHFLSIPLIDVCRQYVQADKRTTFPTPVLESQSRHPEVRRKTNERLDYLLISPQLLKSVVDAFIFNDGDADYLSDHYPIAVDLIIEVNS